MLTRTCAALAACAMLSIPTPARAQHAGDDDAATIAAYRLTLPTLQKMIAAMHTMRDAMMKDPRFRDAMTAQQELETLKDKENRTPADDQRIEALEKQTDAFEKSMGGDDDSSDDTLADMERKFASVPHMSESLKSAGLTPHEFATFEMCVLQAGIAAGTLKDGQPLPAGMQQANVQFVKDHQKELAALSAAMQGSPK